MDRPSASAAREARHELGDRERFFRLLADNAQDVLFRYRVRPQPGFEYVSPSCTRITGYTPEEHYADPELPLKLVHPDDRPLLDAMYAEDVSRDGVLLRWVRRDGTVVWTEQRTVALRDDAGRIAVVEGIARDVTARKRAQDRVEAMIEVTQASLQQKPADEVLELIAGHARDLAMAALGVVVVPDGNELVRVRAAMGAGADVLRGAEFPAAGTVAAQVMRTGAPVRFDEAAAAEVARSVRAPGTEGPILAVPLGTGESTVGVLSLVRGAGAPVFSDDDLEMVNGFARQAAMVLERSRLRDELQRMALQRDRERIARELHDGVIQALFGVGMVLQVAESEDADDRLIRTRIGDAMADIDRIIYDVRSYVYRLRPALLQRATLADALQRMVSDVESRHGVVGAVESDDAAVDLLAPVAADVVQTVRAALINVARHARALTCRVVVQREGEVVRLAVEDDGAGFDTSAPTTGQGLENLRARAAELGGWLLVHSSADAGTTVELIVPVAVLQRAAEEVAEPA